MPTVDFDLDRFIRTSDRVDLSDVDWDRASDPPLADAEVRALRYMMDIETNTVIFLRDVLVTVTAFDPDVTAFLSCWNFEELWHGEAFSRLLGEAGIPVRPDHEAVTHGSRHPSRRSRKSGSGGGSARRGTSATWARCSDRRSRTKTSWRST